MFTGLTFVWSSRACVTYQQSCKSLSHSNYLQLLLQGRPPFPHRRDRPAVISGLKRAHRSSAESFTVVVLCELTV